MDPPTIAVPESLVAVTAIVAIVGAVAIWRHRTGPITGWPFGLAAVIAVIMGVAVMIGAAQGYWSPPPQPLFGVLPPGTEFFVGAAWFSLLAALMRLRRSSQ